MAIASSTSVTLPSAVTISPSGSYKNFKASASNRLVDGVQIRSERDHVLRHLIGQRHELLQVTVRSGATPEDGTIGRWEDKGTLTCHARALRAKPENGCVHTRAVSTCTVVYGCCACYTGAREEPQAPKALAGLMASAMCRCFSARGEC